MTQLYPSAINLATQNQIQTNDFLMNYPYYNSIQNQNIPVENLPPPTSLYNNDDLSKNSLLFAKSNRIIVLEDEKKLKEAENLKKNYIEHPWAVGSLQNDKNEQNLLFLKTKGTPHYLENKTEKVTSNYRTLDDFIEFKPKRYLKSLENEQLGDLTIFEDDDKQQLTQINPNNQSTK